MLVRLRRVREVSVHAGPRAVRFDREAGAARDDDRGAVQKASTQRILAILTLGAAAAVGLHLLAVAGFKFSFDDDGFVLSGRRFKWSDIGKTDESKWETKRILVISGAGWSAKLDAWHHEGVKEFRETMKGKVL